MTTSAMPEPVGPEPGPGPSYDLGVDTQSGRRVMPIDTDYVTPHGTSRPVAPKPDSSTAISAPLPAQEWIEEEVRKMPPRTRSKVCGTSGSAKSPANIRIPAPAVEAPEPGNRRAHLRYLAHGRLDWRLSSPSPSRLGWEPRHTAGSS